MSHKPKNSLNLINGITPCKLIQTVALSRAKNLCFQGLEGKEDKNGKKKERVGNEKMDEQKP